MSGSVSEPTRATCTCPELYKRALLPSHTGQCPLYVPPWEAVPQDPALLRNAMADLKARQALEERPSTGHFDQRCEALETLHLTDRDRIDALTVRLDAAELRIRELEGR